MDAILLSGGGINPKDPLYEIGGNCPKALIPIAGKPMIQWVIDALVASESIDRIILAGLGDSSGLTIPCEHACLPDGGSLIANVRSGARAARSELAVIVSADIPTLQAHMVDWVCHAAAETNHDLYYGVVDKEVLEQGFPGSRRSFLTFADQVICSSDLGVMRTKAWDSNAPIWERFTQGRKSSLKLALAVGPDILILFLLRLLKLEKGVAKASKRIGVRARVLYCPFAELGMDADKPYQFTMLQDYLLRQQSATDESHSQEPEQSSTGS